MLKRWECNSDMTDQLENALFSDRPLSNAPLTEGASAQTPAGEDTTGNPFMHHVAEAVGSTANAFWSSKAGRFLTGAAEPVTGAAQLAAHMSGYGVQTTDRWADDLEKFYQSQRAGAGIRPGEWDIPAGLGNVLSPVNVGPVGVLGKGKTVLGMLGRGAVAGGLYGATEPIVAGHDYEKEKLGQVEAGAAAGAIAGPASEFAARAVDPLIGRIRAVSAAARSAGEHLTPEESYALAVRSLNEEGVKTTAAMNWGPEARRLEDWYAATPVVGSFARGANANMYASYNTAAVNRALGHIGEELPSHIRPGHEAVAYTADRLGKRFDALFEHATLRNDPQLQQDWVNIIRNADQDLTENEIKNLNRFREKIFDNVFTPSSGASGEVVLNGEQAQNLISKFKQHSLDFSASSDPYERNLGYTLNEVVDAMTSALERQNPDIAQPLRDANMGWRDYARVRAASASQPAQAHEGRFTATQLGTAARMQDKSVGKTQSAHGTAPMQDLVEWGRQVMPSQMPNSGTPERTLLNAAILGTATISPQMAALAASAPVMYSPPMQSLMRRYAMSENPLKGLAARGIRGVAVPATVSLIDQANPTPPAGLGGIGIR
jgi:hypothetical protein